MFAYRTLRAAGQGRPAWTNRYLTTAAALALLAASLGGPGICQAESAGANAPASAAEPAAIAIPSDVRYCNQPSILVRYRWTGAPPKGVQMWISLDGTKWLPWAWSDKPAEPFAFTPPRQGKVLMTLAPAERETTEIPASGCQSLAIVFDFDKPLLRLGSTQVKDGPAGICVQMTWSAWDENFAERPMSLHWRRSAEEPWQQGLAELPNNGACEWAVPAALAGKTLQVCLRAADQAGNVAEATTEVATKVAAQVPAPTAQAEPAPAPATRPAASRPADPAVPSAAAAEAERLCEMAQQRLTQGEFDMAEDMFREAIGTDPTYHAGHMSLGILLQRRGRHAEAIGEYQAVLALKPDNATAWRNLALAYMSTKDYPKARITLQKLLAIEPDGPQTWIDLGDVEMLMGRSESARQCWDKAKSLSKPNTDTATRAAKRLSVYGNGK